MADTKNELKPGDYLSYLPAHFGAHFKGVYIVEDILNKNKEQKTMLVRVRLQE